MATTSPLTDLGAILPVVAAPMAGGPTTPALVAAAASVGALGFLAAGYKTPEAVQEEVSEVAARTPLFGVNLFAPHPVPVDPAAYRSYRDLLSSTAERLGVQLPEVPREDDDAWRDKIDVLVARPVPIVSFTFGMPDADGAARLRAAGSLLAQTVTTVGEAREAAEAGADVLVVQGPDAGGHAGTFDADRRPAPHPLADLVAEVAAATGAPLLAAGGVMDTSAVAEVLRAGASGVAVGTALLLSPESGASTAHRAALTDTARGDTVLTRAYTGRYARSVPTGFVDRFEADAPGGYPALHHLTRPIRAAAAAAGDPDLVNPWAGAGYRAARSAPAAEILTSLAASA